MNWELYDKYGERNKDGFYIENHEKWNHYAMNPKLYKIMTIKAWLFICCKYQKYIQNKVRN